MLWWTFQGLAVAFLGGFFSSLGATTYVVTPNGSGTGSLSGALAVWNPGDTIIMGDGSYNLTSQLIITRGGASAARCILKAQNKGKAVLLPAPGDQVHVWASYINLDGFTIDGKKKSKGLLNLGNMEPAGGKWYDGIIATDLFLTMSGSSGIHVSSCRNLLIKNSSIVGTGYLEPYGEAFYVGSITTGYNNPNGVEVYGCVASDFTENAIDTKQGTNNIKFHNNRFEKQVSPEAHGVSAPGRERNGVTLRGLNTSIDNNTFEDLDLGTIGGNVVQLLGSSNQSFSGNIVRNVTGVNAVGKNSGGSGSPNSRVFNNQFINSPNKVESTISAGYDITGNCGLNYPGNTLTCVGSGTPTPPVVQPPIIIGNGNGTPPPATSPPPAPTGDGGIASTVLIGAALVAALALAD